MREVMFFRSSWALLLAGLLVAGCAAQENQMLEEARAAYTAASSDPQLVANAPTELKEAADTLREAENLFEEEAESDQVTHQAYLARQRVAIAREAAELKLGQEAIASAETQRQDVLLQARSREAQTARQQAEARQKELEEARLLAQERGREAAQSAEEMQQLKQELAELQAQPTERGIVLTLKDVVFSVDQAELKPGAERVVDKVAEFLNNHPERTVAVEGFTDATGPEDYNKKLSEERAQAVREALVQRGIDPQRIITRGYGEQYPVASNETPAGRQLNRRVEIIISNGEEQVSMR